MIHQAGCKYTGTRVNTTYRSEIMNDGDNNNLFQAARRLLNSSFHGVLASHSLDYPGYPFGSALPFSIAADGWPLLLISHLARHTRNLLADSHCSLTLIETGEGDLQQRLRLTMLARALPLQASDGHAEQRHFRYYPNSLMYHEQLNFRFFRLLPERFYFVGGFGTARWIGIDRLSAENPFADGDEARILRQLETEFGGALCRYLRIGQVDSPAGEGALIPVGLDAHGLDLRHADSLFRVAFQQPVSNLDQAIQQLGGLLSQLK